MSLKASEKKKALKSLGEEKQAIKDYKDRLKDVDDPSLKKAFRHAIPEEQTHAHLFREALK